MDLNAVEEVGRPRVRADLPSWRPGDALLAGGTWLFSEPQPDVRRLVDLTALGWPASERDADGLHLAATCTLAELEALDPPADWVAASVLRPCCRALAGSFKVTGAATVGGNLCLALPASPVAAEVAPKTVKAARTAPRKSRVSTRRPRRVSRTSARGERAGRAARARGADR